MKIKYGLAAAAICVLIFPWFLAAQSAKPIGASKPAAPRSADSALDKKVEDYLRYLYGWDDTFTISFAPAESTGMPDVEKVAITVTNQGQSETAVIFVSKDGNYMFRGEMEDLTSDPLAAIRAEISLDDSPSRGPADAKVVIVEFGDFQCPVCRSAEMELRHILPQHPDVRFVFKDYPLVDIHPWAMTAALAGRCAYQQSKAGFWKLHDLIYDNQALISTANVYDKMQEYATQVGLDGAALRTCMADPKTQSAVGKSMTEGQHLQVANTPTFFVDGRRLIGLDVASFSRLLTGRVLISPSHP